MKTAIAVLLALFALSVTPIPKALAEDNPSGSWVQIPQPVTPPAIDGGAMCWDPVRGRMIVFGGRNGTIARNDVWAMTPGPTVKWQQLAPLGTPPSPRFAPTMVYDSIRDRMIVYGGSPNTNTPLADAFELTLSGTPKWNPIVAPNPPPGRLASVSVFDPDGDRMIVFSGLSGFNNLGDTWQLSFAGGTPAWTQLSFTDPTPGARSWSTAVYDAIGKRMVICGGAIGQGPPLVVFGSDVWTLSLTGTPAWTNSQNGGAPGLRGRAAMYDSDLHRMVLFGGWNGNDWRSDVAVLDLDTMVLGPAIPMTEKPWECERACMAYDPVGKRGVVFGGSHGAAQVNRAWSLWITPKAWWAHLEPAPPPRNGNAAIYDPVRHEMVQFGGKSNFGGPGSLTIFSDQDSWSLSLDANPTWRVLASPGTPVPTPRDGPILVRDPAHDRLLMFGGAGTSGEFLNDLWSFDLATRQWSQLDPAGPLPPGRFCAGGAFDPVRSRMFVFSSENFGVLQDDMWELDLEPTPAWVQVPLVDPRPSARFSPTMLYDPVRDRILLFGGVSKAGEYLGDTWSLSLGATPTWSQVFPFGQPPLAAGTTTVYDSHRDRLVVFGGNDRFGSSNKVFALSLSGSPAWMQLPTMGTPPPGRSYGTGAYDGAMDRMIITQGQSNMMLNDTWSLEFDQPVPVLLSLVDEQVGAGTVRLTWFSPDGPGHEAIAQRSDDGLAWSDLGTLISDASGEFVLEDRVPTGGRLAYRIATGGRFSDTHWVTVSSSVAFGIMSTGANPSRGALPVTFALPSGGDAALDLYAVNGRRVFHRSLSGMDPGVHSVDLASGLANGLYVLQLTQGATTAVRKVVVTR